MNVLQMILAAVAVPALYGQVSHERLRNATAEPHNWLTYNGSFASTHHSALSEITPENARKLELKWVWQANSLEKLEATPLVVDGVMYLTDPPNDVVAIDARTGRVFWTYRHQLPAGLTPCCGRVNRGLAMLDNTLYMGTLDGRLIALDASTGRKRWDVQVVEYQNRLLTDIGAARDQRQNPDRSCRRRDGNPGIHRRI